jgi:two-component system sensor histidine kinase HydH
MPLHGFRLSLSRGGPLVVALLLGAALVASASLSYRDATYASQVLTERQGGHIFRRLRMDLGDGAATPERLRSVLESNREIGVTYIGFFNGGAPALEAGASLWKGAAPAVGELAMSGRRARMAGPMGRYPRDRRDAGGGPPGGFGGPPGEFGRPDGREPSRSAFLGGPGGGGPGGPGHGGPGWFGFRGPSPYTALVIEFDAIGTQDLQRNALVGLWLASGAALLLTSAALFMWRSGRRAARLAGELEQQRHLATLGGMSAVLAHEIRNPLAALKGHAQLLAEKATEPAITGRVKRVVDEALRLEALTNDLLDFAKSGAVTPQQASPLAVLEAAVQATVPDRIERPASGAPAVWRLDPARMEQVLINLLENAIQVTPAERKVTAVIEVRGKELVFSVRDHGPGVPAAERSRIFEPFHTTKIRGTGLGLAVVKRIVELHGGRVEIDDGPDGGAVFSVYIPSAA